MARAKWRNFLGVTVTVILVIAIGIIGLVTSNAARSQAASTHRQDRLLLQQTLASLVEQFVKFSLQEAYGFASTGSWSLMPDDAADKARLEAFVKRSPVFNHGAALLSMSGERLTTFSVGPGLPPRGDPGYAPMARSLIAGKPGLSSVMDVGGTPVVAAAVPVEVDGKRVALLVGFSRVADTQLQAGAQRLSTAISGRGYVVDSEGRAVAAARADLVGKRVDSPAVPTPDREWGSGFLSFTRDGEQFVTSYSPIGIGGWGLVAEQSEDAFYGAIDASSRRVQLSMMAGLVFASGALIAVFRRRHRLLRREAARTRQILDTANDAFLGMDQEGTITEWNLQAEHLFGWSRAEAIGKPLTALVIAPEEQEPHAHELAEFLTTEKDDVLGRRLELTGLHRSGRRVPVELTISAVGKGEDISFNAFIHDITERKEVETRLQLLALHDFLTGLPNRVLIMDRLGLALARSRRDGSKVALLFLDLDGFKVVNDTLGHDAGDELLITIASRLKATLRPSDTAGRLGGDEFVVVCDGVANDYAIETLVSRIKATIAQPCTIGGTTIEVGVSVGIAVATENSDPESLLRQADRAMYERKKLTRA